MQFDYYQPMEVCSCQFCMLERIKHGHKSPSFIAYISGTNVLFLVFLEQNLEIGQCYYITVSF